MARGENGQGEDRQDEWYESRVCACSIPALTLAIDQQLGQLHELMKAIQKQGQEDDGSED